MKKMTRLKKRAQRRFLVARGTTVSLAGSAATLLDIGMGGARVSTALSLRAGESLQLSLSFDRRQSVEVAATVVATSAAGVHLSFPRGQGALRNTLSRIVMQLDAECRSQLRGYTGWRGLRTMKELSLTVSSQLALLPLRQAA